MCTSLALTTRDFYFGRNLDLECGFGERVVITPRCLPFQFRREKAMTSHYAMIGMATVANGYPLYAEAVNEAGLGIAGLNFPGNAYYSPEEVQGKSNISPFELIPWLLGQCATVAEVRVLLKKTHIININFSENMPLSPLHWHIADRAVSIVVECTRDGMHIYENPAHVMTNNPTFDFHLTNLRQYMHLTSAWPENSLADGVALTAFGAGMGAMGMPGDFSPASRFIKAAFLRLNSVCSNEDGESVAHFFHLLDAVAMPRGSVATEAGHWDITTYSCCVNATRGIYYYKTYGSGSITALDMHRVDLDGERLYEYPIQECLQVNWAN